MKTLVVGLGGFGPCGVPVDLIDALADLSADRSLTVVGADVAIPGHGTGKLILCNKVKKVIAGFVGHNDDFLQRYMNQELELELSPMGTLAERLRCAGAGIPAFWTPTGAGTPHAEGREERLLEGKRCILETALPLDVALVRAHQIDRFANIRFRKTARNFNPVVAVAARICLVEYEHLVESIDPDQVHLPGIYVHRAVPAQAREKRIEHRTVRLKS